MPAEVWKGELLGSQQTDTRGGPCLEVMIQRPNRKYKETARSWDDAVIREYGYLLMEEPGAEVTIGAIRGEGNHYRLVPMADAQREAATAALTPEQIRQRSIERQSSIRIAIEGTGPWDIDELLSRWDDIAQLGEQIYQWIEAPD